MSTFLAIYWPACMAALGGFGVLGLSRLATRMEGVRLAIVMFGIGALCMAAAIAYARYLVHGIHFTGPPSAVPGQTVLVWATRVSASAMFVPMGASLTCFVKRMRTGGLAFASSAAFMSCVTSELSSLANDDSVWRGLLVAGIVGAVVAALLAYTMAVWHRH